MPTIPSPWAIPSTAMLRLHRWSSPAGCTCTSAATDAALDTKTGAVLWKRSDLPCRHYRGPGSSLVLFENLLILTMDGVDIQYLVALDKETGRTVWKTDRTAEWNDLDADGKPQTRRRPPQGLLHTAAGDR